MRLAVCASHPIQYQAPIFRELARRLDLTVFFAHEATPTDQARAGFGVEFSWDSDLLGGFEHAFLRNIAAHPTVGRYSGCDTPGIWHALKESRYDAALIMGWHLKSFHQALMSARLLGTPTLVRSDSQLPGHRSPMKRLVKSFTYPPLLRLFDVAFYVGSRSRDYFRHYAFPADRLFFSPHAIDNEWFRLRATQDARLRLRGELGVGETESVALFAGKLLPRKRPVDVVRAAAFAASRGRPITVLFAGSGELEAEVRSEASAAGVTAVMLGFRNQTEMPAVYAASDFLVLPSDGSETWGLVANEALACGRPVILSDAVGSAPDLAGDGTAGRTFTMGDIRTLSEAMVAFAETKPLSGAIAAKAEAHSIRAAVDGICQGVEVAACTPRFRERLVHSFRRPSRDSAER